MREFQQAFSELRLGRGGDGFRTLYESDSDGSAQGCEVDNGVFAESEFKRPSGFWRVGISLSNSQVEKGQKFIPHEPDGAEFRGELVIGRRCRSTDESIR